MPIFLCTTLKNVNIFNAPAFVPGMLKMCLQKIAEQKIARTGIADSGDCLVCMFLIQQRRFRCLMYCLCPIRCLMYQLYCFRLPLYHLPELQL